MERKTVFSTPWFELVAKTPPGQTLPHYVLVPPDYVTVIAVTGEGQLVLVRQFRPAVEAFTLELPSGHVDPGQTPERTARQELLEETGYVAGPLEFLGELCPDTGRLSNRLWCYFASGVTPTDDPAYCPEPGVEPVLYSEGLIALLAEKDFTCALNVAVLMLAVARGRLTLPAI